MAKRPTLIHARPRTLAHLLVGDGAFPDIRIPVQIMRIWESTNGAPWADVRIMAERGTHHVKGAVYATRFSNLASRTPTTSTLIPVWRKEN